MKKEKILILATIIVCCTMSTVFAKEPIEFAEEFFSSVKAGNVAGAYDNLFAGSGILDMKKQAMDMAKLRTESGLKLYGAILGFEKIREEKINDIIVRLVYILKSEKMPTVWEIYFYKPKADWFCANILFNDQFQFLDSKF